MGVTATAADNSLARLVHIVQEAQDRKGASQRIAERIAKPLVPGVLVVAAALERQSEHPLAAAIVAAAKGRPARLWSGPPRCPAGRPRSSPLEPFESLDAMTEQKQIVVTRVIDAPAEQIFDALTDPSRHQEFDGSGMIVSVEGKIPRLQAVGEKFTMNMHHESQGGDYQMENHVVSIVVNELIAWTPARPGQQPPGWKWIYLLASRGPNTTRVVLTYDWENVTDEEIAANLPAIPAEALEESLNRLAAVFA